MKTGLKFSSPNKKKIVITLVLSICHLNMKYLWIFKSWTFREIEPPYSSLDMNARYHQGLVSRGAPASLPQLKPSLPCLPRLTLNDGNGAVSLLGPVNTRLWGSFSSPRDDVLMFGLVLKDVFPRNPKPVVKRTYYLHLQADTQDDWRFTLPLSTIRRGKISPVNQKEDHEQCRKIRNQMVIHVCIFWSRIRSTGTFNPNFGGAWILSAIIPDPCFLLCNKYFVQLLGC